MFRRSNIPKPPAGWFDHRYMLLADGKLAILRTDSDIYGELHKWRTQGLSPISDIWSGDTRISVFDGEVESDAIAMPTRPHPVLDRFRDGRWLVASARSGAHEKNASIFDRSGSVLREIVLGDAIEHVRCAPDGTIWVGYFDEGIYSLDGKKGHWPISTHGLVKLDDHGSLIWSFLEQADLRISDCYALAQNGDEIWTSYYSDFPIVRILNDKVAVWQNDVVSGANAIATDGTHVLLAGGYGENRSDLCLLELRAEEACMIGKSTLPATDEIAPSLVQGMGETMHVVSDGAWWQTSIHDVLAHFRT